MFIVVDGKRFNAGHITSIEAKKFDWSGKEFYKVFILAQPEGYTCDTNFKTRKECEDYIDGCLGDAVEDNIQIAKDRKDREAEELRVKESNIAANEKAKLNIEELEIDDEGEIDWDTLLEDEDLCELNEIDWGIDNELI